MLIDGRWVDKWYDTDSTGGRFVREQPSFRGTLSSDGPHPPAAGRYHLYVSLACPWAHRALIMRKLKGLEQLIDVSIVAPLMLEHGWQFDAAYPDRLYGARCLHELYTRAQPTYTGRVTVPVLWDKHSEQIVNNESGEVIRILDQAFEGLGARSGSFYPEPLRAEIDAVNQRVYDHVNNGVYKAGFATSREAYEEAFDALFGALDWLEERLSGHDYLVGDRLTEADIRLFTTLVRFDAVYYAHFKCNLRHISDYPNLRALRSRIYGLPGLAETVDIAYIKQHYFGSHRKINPTGIVPKGPRDWL